MTSSSGLDAVVHDSVGTVSMTYRSRPTMTGMAKRTPRLWRPDTGDWWILTSSSGYTRHYSVQWGASRFSDVPVLGDFDGDRIADLVVYRPYNGTGGCSNPGRATTVTSMTGSGGESVRVGIFRWARHS